VRALGAAGRSVPAPSQHESANRGLCGGFRLSPDDLIRAQLGVRAPWGPLLQVRSSTCTRVTMVGKLIAHVDLCLTLSYRQT